MIPRILIIDDEADIREVTALSLETIAGWQVILAPSGAQGIRRASLEQPDAILLDVMMPDIDGPTTYQILKQNGNTAHIPVLLLTAKVQGQDRRKLDELGAAAFSPNPSIPSRWQTRSLRSWAGNEGVRTRAVPQPLLAWPATNVP
jgi:CheY-like chemotaxis protein